ncbi:hypothetical protein SpAn4DRAFT_3212 [Sporomusa ovata]|uniref:Uncharacterized protein n=1 Tax=Sporomusa ovata TaxID=2378 RepID=A0A0U1KZB1_9FIRM|nr:hypothetical protein [Sporomusa ovata]CQR72752.1 hypothetical protein SpAn4DRAFT_3212 [Sporomusa ovata]
MKRNSFATGWPSFKAGWILVTGTPAEIKSMTAREGDLPGTLEDAFLLLIRRGAE